MTNKKTPVFCDWSALGSPRATRRGERIRRGEKTGQAKNKNSFYKHRGKFSWQGVKAEKYKLTGGDWADIARHTLIGNKGETSKFHVRYFEIAPKGHSSFERHKHEHVVICVKGKGKALAGKRLYEMNFMDALYISPNTPHQLRNPFKSPFGFFCIVNAKRDKPKLLTA